ncbi:hypothetical protein C8Q75DRAFT_808311 [Abortiporus biennis]|nr:hypothetical protein C8Q75DRAFT_808311 [Abortiporus biennis]
MSVSQLSATPDVEFTVSPSFSDDDADFIIRTGDNIDFKVYRAILGRASPVFKDMFALPQSPPSTPNASEYINGLPIVHVTEDSKTMDLVLTFCYPIPKPAKMSITDIRDILEATRKYQMDYISSLVRPLWREAVRDEPLRGFAIACSMHWEDEARIAARLSLEEPIWPIEPPLPQEFRAVSADTMVRLISYHRRCGKEAVALASNGGWANQMLDSLLCDHCTRGYKSSGQAIQMGDWLKLYMKRAGGVLATMPSRLIALDQNLVHQSVKDHYGISICDMNLHCMDKINKMMMQFADELDKVLNEVPLDLGLDH